MRGSPSVRCSVPVLLFRAPRVDIVSALSVMPLLLPRAAFVAIAPFLRCAPLVLLRRTTVHRFCLVDRTRKE
jgi:hypothetical protein